MRIELAAALAAAALAAGCASRPTHPDAFAFAVMGDTQYNANEERAFVEMMQRVDREALAFVVHVGDIVGGSGCPDGLYARRRAEFDASAHPFIFTPGDNEWVDCASSRGARADPLERLAKLREVFFPDRHSLGRRRIETLAQDRCLEPAADGCRCGPFPENRFWTYNRVRFVTLNVPGSENNTGVTRASSEEAACRMEANRRWLELAINAAERSQTRGLVIAFQANPFHSKRDVYRPLIRQIEEAWRRIRKPVLVVHGDTHDQRIDAPFVDSLGNTLLGITRLETFGSPFTGWVKVTVDPDDPQVFQFEPKLVRLVPP